MKIVGLTGGIGSGKTTAASFFKEMGVPVYIADEEAKMLMNKSETLRKQLTALFGSQAYINEALNKTYIAEAIFNNKALLQQMNKLVHPIVAKHFNNWVLNQQGPYVIKESAILFEHGADAACHYTILVTAPEPIRISRVIARDGKTEAQVRAIIANQMPDAEKRKKASFVIENIDLQATKEQVRNVHLKLLKTTKTS
ncbi:dephospho-CoA kinase [Bizionia sediminis]|uniref:Dephospho-CoA kinase n=1 Tax=Bizionia sediminis TaxID=1737064 RepID=A0ABW5KV47_9FLAO